jgi:hypothetical protein
MSSHVFVSYSRSDDDYVNTLIDILRRAGLAVWVDHAIEYGVHWDTVAREKIDSCAAFVLVMTPAAEASYWVREEVARARILSKPILPLLLAGKPFFGFGNTHYSDVTDGRMPSQRFLDQLSELARVDIVAPSIDRSRL